METSELKQKLHVLIDNSPEEKLMEIYSVLIDDYSDELKATLNEEYIDYKTSGEVIPKEELDKRIKELLSVK